MPGRRYRKREVELERVLGAPALFATAYGNVGVVDLLRAHADGVLRARADAAPCEVLVVAFPEGVFEE